MDRQINIIISDCIETLRRYPNSKKFDENVFFSEASLSIVKASTQVVVRGGKDSDKVLNDMRFLNDFIYILENGKNNAVRYLVANLTKQLFISTMDNSITRRLVQILDTRDINDRTVVPLLYAIPKGSEGLFTLGRFLDSDNKNIRNNTVWAITQSKSADVRPLIERSLESIVGAHSGEFLRALFSLGRLGNETSVKYLMPYLLGSSKDTQSLTLGVVEKILKESGADLYLSLLSDKRFRVKTNAVTSVTKYCGEEALEAVIKRVKTILSRERSYSSTYKLGDDTELTLLIKFSSDFYGNEKTKGLCKYVAKKTDKFTAEELEILASYKTL